MATKTAVSFVAALLLALFATTHAPAQVPPMWEDDFETDIDPVSREPDGWEQLTGKGFPEYDQIVFPDTETVKSGKFAVRFKLLGGNMAMEHATFLPITPGRSYRASGWIRVEGLRKSVAYISLQIYDKKGFPLESHRSDPVEGTSDWTEVYIDLHSMRQDGSFMRMRCSLEGGDISGAAWFDGVQIVEQTWIEFDTAPNVRVETGENKSGNIFKDVAPDQPRPQKIRATVKLRGAQPGDYLVTILCTDFLGKPSADPLLLKTIKIDESGSLDLSDDLQLQKRGYTEVNITASRRDETGKLVVTGSYRTSLGVVDGWLLQRPKSPWLGCDLDPYPDGARDLVPLMNKLGVRLVLLRVWNEKMPAFEDAMKAAELDAVLVAASASGVEFVGTFGTPSLWARRAIFSGKASGGPSLFLLDESIWQPPLVATIERLKTQVSTWLFGTPGVTAFTGQDFSKPIAARLAGVVKSVIEFPELGIPLTTAPQGKLPSIPTVAGDCFTFATVHVPASVPADETGAGLAAFRSSFSKLYVDVALLPQSQREKETSVPRQVSELAKRLAEVRAAGISQVFASPMQNQTCGLVDDFGNPTAAAYTFLVINRALSNKVFDPRRIFAREIEHRVFHGDDESAVMLWLADDAAKPVRLPVSLGDGVRVLHLDGNLSPLQQEGQVQFVEVANLPCLLVGISPAFLDMQLSVALLPQSIDCAEGKQKVAVNVLNTFPSQAVSSLEINAGFPSEWTVTRTSRTVAQLPAGATATLSTEVAMPLREVLGVKEIPIVLRFVSGGKEYVGQIVRPLVVRSELVTKLELERTPDGLPAALSLSVQNLGERFVDAKCYVHIPGIQERDISMRALAPAAVRIQKIPLSLPADAHGTIHVHVVEEGGKRLFLNDKIDF